MVLIPPLRPPPSPKLGVRFVSPTTNHNRAFPEIYYHTLLDPKQRSPYSRVVSGIAFSCWGGGCLGVALRVPCHLYLYSGPAPPRPQPSPLPGPPRGQRLANEEAPGVRHRAAARTAAGDDLVPAGGSSRFCECLHAASQSTPTPLQKILQILFLVYR